MARVIRTLLAREDLKEIGRYIARESQDRSVAFRFLDSIEQKLQLYATQPEMGERRPDLGRNVRHFPVGQYVVFYRPIEAGIEILRVLHGRRDIPSILRRRDS